MEFVITLILSIVMMVGFFLMLLAAVAFIQDKRLFTSSPKQIQEVIQPKKERFKGQHVVGWILMAFAIVLLFGPLVYGGIDGILNHFAYWEFFLRYAMMVILIKAFDILFFDYYLLCHSNFFPHYYPECKDIIGPQLFGFNKKSHIIQIILMLLAAAAVSGICILF